MTQFKVAMFLLKVKCGYVLDPALVKGFEIAYTTVVDFMWHINCTLSYGRNTQCLDPRDKVYGLISLINDLDKKIHIKPDYKKTTLQVYVDFTLEFLRKRKVLDILAHCFIPNC